MTKEEFLQEIEETLPDNEVGAITPEKLRYLFISVTDQINVDVLDRGGYNATTNQPTLTSDATAGNSSDKVQQYIVQVGGVLAFSVWDGVALVASKVVKVGDRLRQRPDGNWDYLPTSDLAYQKVSKIEELIYSGEVDSVLFSVAETASTGWAGTNFQGWSYGHRFTNSEVITKIKLKLSQVNTNETIRFEFWKRPIANSASALSFGQTGSSDTLIENKVYSADEFADTSDLQTLTFILSAAIETTPDFIYGFKVRGYTSGGGVGRLGTDRAAIVGSTLQQYERGWYYGTTGILGILDSNATYRASSQWITTENDNVITQALGRVTDVEQQLSDVQSIAEKNQNMLDASMSKGTILIQDAGTFTDFNTEKWTKLGWEKVANGVQATANGLANFFGLYREYALADRKCTVVVTLGVDSRFMLHTRHITNNASYSTLTECDVAAGKIRLYKNYNPGTLPAVHEAKDFYFVAGRKYIVELEKKGWTNIIRVIDTVSGASESISDNSNTTGRQHDRYCMCNYSGAFPVVHSIVVSTPVKVGCDAIFLSDSNGEGRYAGLAEGEGYAFRLLKEANLTGSVSGRGAGNIVGLQRRLESEVAILKPRMVIITIGTNGGNTLVNLRTAVNTALAAGAKVILNNIPACAGNDNDYEANNAMLQTIREEFNLKGALLDVVTATNNNPEDGVDTTLSILDSGTIRVHFLPEGHKRMANRFRVDVPELFL